ncbi:hypothetical protein PENTCL1PPCAC_22169, partial [Pristionchus entomophagus]
DGSKKARQQRAITEKNGQTGVSRMGSAESGKVNGHHLPLARDETDDFTHRVFSRRWAMLIMFILLSGSNGMQWTQYTIIVDHVTNFYGVTPNAVDWTSMIYMLTYILFFVPASWFLDRFGLRWSLLLGAAGNCIGAWIKILSTSPDAFWITFIGQTIVGGSQMFTLGIPPKLAAVWFGSDEVSTACAAGVFGNQLGIAVGFLLPTLLVYGGTVPEVSTQLNHLFLISAVLNSFIFVLILCFFADKPPLPASAAQAVANEEEQQSHGATLKGLLTDRNFLLLFVTYGLNTGVFYAVSTLLAQITKPFFPDANTEIGTIGLLIVVAGMGGSVVGGFVLDRFKKFKLTTLLVYLFSCLGMTCLTFTLPLKELRIVYVNGILMGFFMTGYLPIGFEFAAEITFPAAEGTVGGLLNAAAQVFGIALTSGAGELINTVNVFTCNITLSAVLLVGAILTALIREDLKRQHAHRQHATVPQSDTALTTLTLTSPPESF